MLILFLYFQWWWRDKYLPAEYSHVILGVGWPLAEHGSSNAAPADTDVFCARHTHVGASVRWNYFIWSAISEDTFKNWTAEKMWAINTFDDKRSAMADGSKIVSRLACVFSSMHGWEVLNDKDGKEIHIFLFDLIKINWPHKNISWCYIIESMKLIYQVAKYQRSRWQFGHTVIKKELWIQYIPWVPKELVNCLYAKWTGLAYHLKLSCKLLVCFLLLQVLREIERVLL